MNSYQHKTFQFENTLNEEQINFFNKQGVLHFKRFIDRQKVITFLQEIDHIQSDLISRKITMINGIPLKYGYRSDKKPIIQRLAFTSHYSPVLSGFLKDERFNALLPLLGDYDGRVGENEKDGLVVNHYENTELSSFKQLGWHTDSPRDLFLGSRIMPMLNVGLHLDDCPMENGGLRFLPGTHKQNLFSLLFKKRYFIDNKPDKREAGFNIEAGDLTIHNGSVWHRVEKSPYTGEKSRRRVMYIPIITGEYQPKHANSRTPFYHKLGQIKLPNLSWRPIPQQAG
jgi:hypothetical protein